MINHHNTIEKKNAREIAKIRENAESNDHVRFELNEYEHFD